MPDFTNETTFIFIGNVNNLGTTTLGRLPKITARFTPSTINSDTIQGNFTGAFALNTSGQKGATSTDYATGNSFGFNFDAVRSSDRYSGTDNKVVPNGIYMRTIIKY